jgi:hypothetical protein
VAAAAVFGELSVDEESNLPHEALMVHSVRG